MGDVDTLLTLEKSTFRLGKQDFPKNQLENQKVLKSNTQEAWKPGDITENWKWQYRKRKTSTRSQRLERNATSWEKGRKWVWLEKDYEEWQMWGRLVENTLLAQGVAGGGALRKGADGEQHSTDNEAGLPWGSSG